MYVIVRSWKSLIINIIGTEWSEVSSLYLIKTLKVLMEDNPEDFYPMMTSH